jgi:hypothetical protein
MAEARGQDESTEVEAEETSGKEVFSKRAVEHFVVIGYGRA